VKRALRMIAWIYLAYLALVVLVLWPLLNTVPHWFVEKNLGRQLHTEFIYFNPFTLDLEVRRAELPERDGSPFFSVDGVSVNLSTESLWLPGLVFDALRVQGLFIHIHQLSSGEFTFADMIPPDDGAPPAPSEPAAIPTVTVHDLDLHARQIFFTREVGTEPFHTDVEDLAIRAQDLSTTAAEGQPFLVYLTGERGGTLHWRGDVSIPAATSRGNLELTNIDLNAPWRLIKPLVGFELVDGRADVVGRYDLNWSQDLDFRVDDGAVRLHDLMLRPQQPDALPDTFLGLKELALDGVTVDGPHQTTGIGKATLTGLTVAGWQEGDRVSLAELFVAHPDGAAPATGAPPEPEPEDTASENGWQVDLGELQIPDAGLRWRSGFTDPGLLQVTPITAVIRGVQWPPAGDTTLDLGLTVNGAATLTVDGTLNLADGNGRLDYALAGLPATWFTPNFPTALHAQITQGEIRAEGNTVLAGFAPTTVAMNGAITDFSGRLRDAAESLTGWKAVSWRDLQVDLEQHRVTVGKLVFDTYSGRIHINEDGTINAQKLWVPYAESVPVAGLPSGSAGEAVTDGDAAGQAGDAAAPWDVAVSLIDISDSQIDFKDDSLPIGFRTVVGELNGEIKGISTAPGAEATVDIEGSVDGYAPVTLAGTAAPLSDPPALDLALDFTGVDLALLTPYSATYAGYAIDQGLLTLNLKYALKDGHLQGNNKVVIDKMKLGEHIDSDKALDIPLKLALALLTDSDGVIDLEVPVSGDVDNPDFSIGSVVMNAFLNLITKAITAPFTLLASLVDSEADLQRVSFPAGSAVLTERGTAKLQQLRDAMAQRPALVLEINGRVQPAKDRDRLQRNALKAELLAGGLAAEDIEGKTPAWESAIAERCAQAGVATEGLSPLEQSRALARTWSVSDEELAALAQARAVAVKSWLVNDAGLSADRAVVGKAGLQDEGNTFSGVELGVDT